MHAVINETLRLFPPVPINQREVRNNPVLFPLADDTFPDQSRIPICAPANTVIIYFQWFTHRNPTLWGPDVDVFDPERWLDDRLTKFTENPMIFTPFSAGPRIVSAFIPRTTFFSDTSTVHRTELCTKRGVFFPRSTLATIRHIHPCSEVPARRFPSSPRMERRQGKERNGKNTTSLCTYPFCKGESTLCFDFFLLSV